MTSRLIGWIFVLLAIFISREAIGQELSFCYRYQCFPTLSQAEQALRQDPQYSDYAPFAVPDRKSVGAEHIYHYYKIPDRQPAHWFSPDFAVPSFSNSTPGCTPNSPVLVKGCPSEEVALSSAFNTQAFYNADIRSDFRPAGSYKYGSLTRSHIGGVIDYGIISFISVYGTADRGLWQPDYGDFRGFDFEAVYGMQSNPVKSYRISIEKRLTFECPAGYQPPFEMKDYPGGDVYSFAWCRPKSGVPYITAKVTQVSSCAANKNPCHPATGDKSRVEVDFEFGERAFARYYHSLGQLDDGYLSKGWSHSFSERVLPLAGAQALITPDGNYETLVYIPGSNLYRTKQDPGGVLEIVSGTGPVKYRYRTLAGEVKEFNPAGRLIAIRSVQNPVRDIELSYVDERLAQVVDARGRSLNFSYAGDRLVRIDLPDGNHVGYAYDGAGQLALADYGNGHVKQYHYGEQGLAASDFSNLLTGITSEDGRRYASFGYDAYGRVTSSRLHADGGFVSSTTLDYVSSDTVKVVTDEHGLKTYKFGAAPYRRMLSVSDGTGVVTNTFVSDRLTQSVDRKGLVANYSYDQGFLAAAYEASGTAEQRRTVLARDADKRIIRRDVYGKTGATEILRSVELTTYDAAGRVAATCRVEPSVPSALAYVCGSQVVPPSGVRQTSNRYCEPSDVDQGRCPVVGLLKSVSHAGGDTADYHYYGADDLGCSVDATCHYRKGDLWKVSNALGQVSEVLRYDGAGRVLSVKDANGVVTDLEYHPRGWLTARKVRGADDASEADDAITRIDYWPTGLVKQVTQPDGDYTTYEYDAAHRLTAVSDNAGHRIEYLLDNAGHRVKEDVKDAGGQLKRTLSRLYNQLGQLATVADAQANATDYGYDANGNLTGVTDALGRQTQHAYDPLNRLKRSLQDVGGIQAETKFEYDVLDHLTKVTDPKGLATTYAYNGLGDLLQLNSPDTGTTTYTYDGAGNRKTQTDARGVTTQYGYDALNRLVSIAYPDSSLDVAYGYDTPPPACEAGERFSVGRLTRMQDGSGSTQYCHDRFGQVVRKVQTTNGVSLVLRYAYTRGGRLKSMTYPDGSTVDYVRDGQGNIREVGVARAGQPRQVLLHQASYHPFGPVAGWVYGDGRSMQRPLDMDYRPLSIEGGTGGLALGFGYDDVGNLTALSSGTPPPLTYGYDVLGRLTATRDGPTQALIDGYGYDKTGNRLSHTTAAGTQAYAYPADSHRLASVAGQVRSYDAVGNTLSNGPREYVYSAANRMSQVKQGGLATMHYAYNGKGEQVRRHIGSGNVYTVYDEAGHWLGDYDGAGHALQQALWMDDLPVGLLANGQQLHYVQPDHLGTPRVVIEAARNVPVWRWDLKGEAFGGTPPEQDPDNDGTPFVFDMRFPGQRFDAASGLNYNYFRDYDASSGRYVQSDPIGLRGGIDTYGYISNTPLAGMDVNGLKKVILFGPNDDPAFFSAIKGYKDSDSKCLVYAHGSPAVVSDARNGSKYIFDAEVLAKLLLASGCTEDMDVTLYACRVGQGENSIAEDLGKLKIFKSVEGPDSYIFYNQNPEGYGPSWIYEKLPAPDNKLPDTKKPGSMRKF